MLSSYFPFQPFRPITMDSNWQTPPNALEDFEVDSVAGKKFPRFTLAGFLK